MWSIDTKASYKVLLMGGLGNQFFQIARAIELRDRSIGVQLVYIDAKLDWLYRLGGHTKHDSWLDVSVLAESLGLKYRSITLLELLSLSFKFFARKFVVISQFNEELDSMLSRKKLGSNTWDVGYFQSIRHVSLASINQVSSVLTDLLGVNESAVQARMVFHIRGGDFSVIDQAQRGVRLPSRVTTDDIRSLVEAAVSDSSRVFVATNDVKFSSEIFQSLDVDFEISKLSPREDFITIATSKNIFVSNSSFAFWAALCAKNAHNSTVYSLNSWPYEDLLSTLRYETSSI